LDALTARTPIRLLRSCSRAYACNVYGKLENCNPTGSHKDRESEEIVRYAVHEGIRDLAIASTGNAAISLAAYSFVHDLKCHVYLPRGIAPERLAQIQAYHPTITFAPSYKRAIAVCEAAAEKRSFLNCNPGARLEKILGDAAIGREIAMTRRPDYVVCPTNNGTLLAGVWRGLKSAGIKTRMVAAVTRKTRLAAAIAGFHRIEEPALSQTLKEARGEVFEVSDSEISEAARFMISDGLVVEGAAAAGLACLRHLQVTRNTDVCCVVTGTGLKFPASLKQLLMKRA
jgi:threonine synthase